MNCVIHLHDNTQETTDRPWFNPVFCEDLLLISFRGDLRMARWIYQRPVDCCHPTELVVAKRLARLGDEWVIRWGFYYETDREGDFIVLGPMGGVLVLEVKGGALRKLSSVGRWEGSSRDHPVAQLSAEWRSVMDALRESANGGDVPFVAKALCLPDIDIDQKTPSYREIDRNLILALGDLASFEVTWHRLFAKHHQTISKKERRVFLDSFAKEVSPKAIEHFISETDRIILRHTIAEYHLLDMLRDNRQLMIEGGPGSGKTWLALEQAFRFANAGLQVLFLCYNVALAEQLLALVKKRKLRNGEVIVRSWESLARELLDAAGVGWDYPVIPTERDLYFGEVVPSLMRDIVSGPLFEPRFDALVVDEAQDHDTCWPGSETDNSNSGWWEVYWKLLREGTDARMAIFYDQAQRPLFRQKERFEAAHVLKRLSQPTHVNLLKTHALCN
jgi:Type III restriction enzyme, res subunit